MTTTKTATKRSIDDRPGAAPRIPAEQMDAIAALLVRADRSDLASRLAAARARHDNLTCTVLIVGEFKKGKSTLVNAIVNAPLSPVDDDLATARPVEVHYAEQPIANLVMPPTDPMGSPVLRPLALDQIASCVLEPLRGPGAGALAVRIGVPRQLLSTGLVLVDTPGVGGLGSAHSAATVGALPAADAVLFVTDTSQEFTSSELEFLRTVKSLCPTVVCVSTKTDFYPAWRKVVEIDRGHLARAGLDCPLMPVSSTLRTAAIERNDRAMNEESGFSELVAFLRDDLIRQVRTASENRLAGEIASILGDLGQQLDSEVRVLDDPDQGADMMRQLEAVTERAGRMRSQSSRWQQTLADGNAELVSETEHDMRQRIRETVHEAEQGIDRIDPAKHWDHFELWLCQRVATDVINNFQLLHHKATALASNVAALFDADEAESIPEVFLTDPTTALFGAGRRPELRLDNQSFATRAISALRGTSGGMIMFSAFAGIFLDRSAEFYLPASMGVGVALGTKMMKDERARQAATRRALAKQAVRRYTDDTMFIVTKESRDTLRRVHRQLRDHFLRRAEELTSAASESLARTKQAVQSSEQARTRRRQEVKVLLDTLGKLRTALELSLPSTS